jgi:hypothetical protein
VAGYRGEPPGIAVTALCEAGRAMGYRVQSIYHPTPIGPGRHDHHDLKQRRKYAHWHPGVHTLRV